MKTTLTMSLLNTFRISSASFPSFLPFFLPFFLLSHLLLQSSRCGSALSSLLDAKFQSSQSTYLCTPGIINNISTFKPTGFWASLVYSHLEFFRKKWLVSTVNSFVLTEDTKSFQLHCHLNFVILVQEQSIDLKKMIMQIVLIKETSEWSAFP